MNSEKKKEVYKRLMQSCGIDHKEFMKALHELAGLMKKEREEIRKLGEDTK